MGERMDISKRGIELIVSFEGKKTRMSDGRYCAYLDTLAKPPVPTIYCGLTKGVRMGMVITEDDGERMFAKELGIYEDAIERLVRVPLNQNQFDALTSFVYNCGVGALQKSTLLAELNKGKYDAVPGQLARWNKAGGVVYRGLVRRRAAEGALWSEPVAAEAPHVSEAAHVDEPHEADAPVADPMPQRVDESKGSVTQAATESWTIRSAVAGMSAGIIQGWDWLFSTAKDAGAEVVAINTAKGPFDALLAVMKVNMVGITAGIAIVACGVVIARRLLAARNGKVG